ncbi:MAG: glycosyltransferase family 2 protein [Candidatus Omnitrophica bacterium]|nr:glycosyltransferase family 2 protein [Candidatus Omnitrophota bacterium]
MVSFIIPSYNSLKTLPRTIESLRAQSVDAFEIIIVDSSDDEMAKKYLSVIALDGIRVISLENKTSPAQGRNIGAQEAKGEILCFIDADIVLAPDWLEKVLAAYGDGCRVGGGSVDIHQTQAKHNLAWAQLLLQFNESLPFGQRREIGLLPACNMFCERKLFFEAKGFPALRASEDVVLCLRLREKNSIWFVPEARAYHIFRESISAYRNNQIMLGQYILHYRREYLPRWYYQGVLPLVFLPMFVLIKFYRMSSRILRNGVLYQQKFLRVLPLFLFGLWFWTEGFAGAIFQKGTKS